MTKFLLFLFGLIMFGCSSTEPSDLDPQEDEELGQAQLGLNARYRPGQRLLGSTGYNAGNVACKKSQAVNTECNFVHPDPSSDVPRIFSVYTHDSAYWGLPGGTIMNAFQAAANAFNLTSFKHGGTVPHVSVVLSNQIDGTECRFGAMNLPDLGQTQRTKLTNLMQVQFNNPTIISDSDCTAGVPCATNPGVWRMAQFADINMDLINFDALVSDPGIPLNKSYYQAIVAGIFQCMGFGYQTASNQSFTYRDITSTVYNLTDAWGSGNNDCETKYVEKYQAPLGFDNPLSFIAFTQAASGQTCAQQL